MTKAEIATIAYFDQFDFPLTRQELDAWCLAPSIVAASAGYNADVLDERLGFYFLKGRDDIVTRRMQRYMIAEKKFLRALRYARLFRLLPSVRMIAICNSLAFSNAREASDIDFFIITKPGTIWLTRFWLQSFLRLFRLRPHDHGVSIQDALCLSFFTDTQTLDFTHLQMTKPDVYLAYWVSHLVTVYDPDALYQKLWKQNEAWVRNILPHIEPYAVTPQRRIDVPRWQWMGKFLAARFWERPLRRFQEAVMPDALLKTAGHDTRVVLSDHMLKFHSNDRRNQYNTWQTT